MRSPFGNQSYYARVLMLAVVGANCAGLPAPPEEYQGYAGKTCQGGDCYPSDQCSDLRSTYRLWGGLALGSGAVSGGGGIGAAFPESKAWRIGAGILSLATATLAVVSVWLRDDVTEEYSLFCTRAPVESSTSVAPVDKTPPERLGESDPRHGAVPSRNTR